MNERVCEWIWNKRKGNESKKLTPTPNNKTKRKKRKKYFEIGDRE